jgi:hypothetical protein
LLIQAISARESFDSFNEKVLSQLIPACQLSQLHVERYERVQRHSESLPNYIQSIRDAALVLRINKSESEVVQRIVEGLNPMQRARFVF